jgi:hypothetical protein
VDIVGRGFVDVGRGNFRDGGGEPHRVVGFIVARAGGFNLGDAFDAKLDTS